MEKDIGKIPKNDQTDIVIRVDDFGGRRGLTIREFVTSDRYTGFTKAGTRISSENFQKFKEMINSIPDEDLVQPAGAGSEESRTTNQTPQSADQSTLNNPDSGSEESVKVEKPGEMPDY